MYGLEAISAANGWAMAAVGALIVFTGLALLTFVISQLHKLLPFLEQKGERRETSAPAPPRETRQQDKNISDVQEQAALFKGIIEKLGPEFSLTELYSQAKEQSVPHPHLSISALREAGILAPLGDGVFRWDLNRLDKADTKAD